MDENTYFAWKHKYRDTILQAECFAPTHRFGLFKTETAAFKAFREYIGQPEVAETDAERYTLVEARIGNANLNNLGKVPLDLSDCPSCTWGQLHCSAEQGLECDECNYSELP